MEGSLTAFAHGFVLALGLILPLGVQNVFIFNQGVTQSRLIRVIPAVVAAALSDTLLILVAVGGVAVVVLKFYWLRVALLFAGIVFLGYMGWVTWQSNPSNGINKEIKETWSMKRQVLFALAVSLLNPHAILDTIAVIGTSSLSYTENARIAFTGACVLVSWIWFIALAVVGRLIRSLEETERVLIVINRISAIIMWGSGVYLATRF